MNPESVPLQILDVRAGGRDIVRFDDRCGWVPGRDVAYQNLLLANAFPDPDLK